MSTLIMFSELTKQGVREIDLKAKAVLLQKYSQPKIAYIPSCTDKSRTFFQMTKDYYTRLGLHDIDYIDFDEEYEVGNEEKVKQYDAFHLSGGNTFYFLHTLQKRGCLELIRDYVNAGGVLIGVSAGSILMTPTIQLAGFGENPDLNDINISNKKALGLVDFEFLPHWDGKNETVDVLQHYAKQQQLFIYACQDDGGVIVDNGKVIAVGPTIAINGLLL